jgi:hypothetical protein
MLTLKIALESFAAFAKAFGILVPEFIAYRKAYQDRTKAIEKRNKMIQFKNEMAMFELKKQKTTGDTSEIEKLFNSLGR